MRAVLRRCCWLVILMAAPLHAAIVPVLDIPGLVAKSDVVATGTVSILGDADPTTIRTPGGQVFGGRLIAVELLVDQVLKGQHEPGNIRFQFSRPDTDFGIGYGELQSLKYRILFLKRNGDSYEPTSPYYPSLISIAGDPVNATASLDAVLDAIVRVIPSREASVADKREAIHDLWGVRNGVAMGGLRLALRDNDPSLQLGAAAALLAAGDVEALAVAEPALLKPEAGLAPELLPNLRGALGYGIKSEEAVPSLARLMRAPEVDTRRAAADALRHTRADAAVPALVRALEDIDRMVQYSAVMGLAEITRQLNGAPSIPLFQQNPDPYLTFWREWSKRR